MTVLFPLIAALAVLPGLTPAENAPGPQAAHAPGAQAGSATVAVPAEASVFDGDPIVASIELRLPHGVDVEGLDALVPVRPGQRLDRRALRRMVRLLYETRRFRQVRVHALPEGDRVAITVVLLPRQRIADVSFVGALRIEGERLERIAGIRRTEDYSPTRVAAAVEAVREAYAEIGYREAEVEPEIREGDDGLTAVLFRVSEGRRFRLSDVRFTGQTGLPAASLEQALGLTPGEPLDLTRLDGALRAVSGRLRGDGYLRAEIGEPRVEAVAGADALARLVVPVRAGSRVVLRIEGNTLWDAAEVRRLMGVPGEEPMTLEVLRDAARRLERRYRLAGHRWAEVRVTETARRGRVQEVRVRIDEGVPMRVERLEVAGAEVFEAGFLRERICDALRQVVPVTADPLRAEQVARLGGRRDYAREAPDPVRLAPEPCTVFDPDAYEAAAEIITDLYRSKGYLSAKVSEPEVRVGPGKRLAEVTVRVVEGVQTVVDAVQFEGAEALEPKALQALVSVADGRPLSYADVEDSRLALLASYGRKGRPFASVDAAVIFSPQRDRAQVRFRLSEGPEVRVGRVIVRGHRVTQASLVRSRLAFRQGDTWDTDRVRRSEQNLLALGIYRSAVVRFLEADEPGPVMDVVVVVNERRPKAVEIGFGVSTEDGPRAFAEFSNLASWMSSELHARAKANYPVLSYGRNLVAPGLEWEAHVGMRFPTLLGTRTDLVWERDNRPAYGLSRVAWAVGTDARWLPPLTASLMLETEYDDMEKAVLEDGHVLTQRERERLLLAEGETLLGSVRPGLVLDLRDDKLLPRRGILASAALDWSHDLRGLGVGDVDLHFLKASAAITGYVPTALGITLALSARGGMVFPLSPDSQTIGPKRFFLGGADSMRGFAVDAVLPQDDRVRLHDQVEACTRYLSPVACTGDAYAVAVEGKRPQSEGGEAFVLVKGELRFPIAGGLQGGLFLDAGNLWSDPSRVDVLALRAAAGAGIRYETPVGPVALDLGFNLSPDPLLREDPFALHFAIGLF